MGLFRTDAQEPTPQEAGHWLRPQRLWPQASVQPVPPLWLVVCASWQAGYFYTRALALSYRGRQFRASPLWAPGTWHMINDQVSDGDDSEHVSGVPHRLALCERLSEDHPTSLFTTTLCRCCYHYPHFADGETEAEGSLVIGLGHTVAEW